MSVRIYLLLRVVVVAIIAFYALPCQGQTLKLVRHFQTFEGNLQFLPGAHVLVEENGREAIYAYSNGSFATSKKPLPLGLRHWTSFDWDGVDYLDQIDQKGYDPAINRFLPSKKKVKKILKISDSQRSQTLILICYTQQSAAYAAALGDRDVFVTALEKTQGKDRSPNYRKLWTKKVETGVRYGNFAYEVVPGMAKFVLLYSVSLGGSGYTLLLDVYQLDDSNDVAN